MGLVNVGERVVVGGDAIVVIAGPCVIEDRDVVLRTAEVLANIGAELDVPLIFKSSFDKANRTDVASFRGPGMEEGLRVLEEVRNTFGMPVSTDIHLPEQAAPCAAVVDLLQIPAFLCRQTDLLVAAGETGKPVNVKKGQFLSPTQVMPMVEKVRSTGNDDVMVTERGSCFGYGMLVNDFASVPLLRKADCPLVFDVTHSVQTPGSGGRFTGGRRDAIPVLARCAAAVPFDALFFEVHPDPEDAMSDGSVMVRLDGFKSLLEQVLDVFNAARWYG